MMSKGTGEGAKAAPAKKFGAQGRAAAKGHVTMGPTGKGAPGRTGREEKGEKP